MMRERGEEGTVQKAVDVWFKARVKCLRRQRDGET